MLRRREIIKRIILQPEDESNVTNVPFLVAGGEAEVEGELDGFEQIKLKHGAEYEPKPTPERGALDT